MTSNEKNLLFVLTGAIILFGFSKTQTGQNIMNTITSTAVDLVKGFEGFSATAYRDARGFSIGYGHFIQPGENFPDAITQTDAEYLLGDDLQKAADTVNKYIHVDLTDNQFSALVSFAYNIGSENFRTSTTVKRINQGDIAGAADSMLWFNKSRDLNGVLQINPTLVTRRADERNLFLS